MKATTISASGEMSANAKLSIKACRTVELERANCDPLRQAMTNTPTRNITKPADKNMIERYIPRALWLSHFILSHSDS